MSFAIYDETRVALRDFLNSVLKDSYEYCDYAKRKTITALDVVYALKRRGRELYGFGSF